MVNSKTDRRRLLGTGVAAGAAALVGGKVAAAATPGTAALARRQDDVVEIEFWKPPHSDKEAELFEPLIAEFEQEHPNIKVKHNIVPWASVDESFTAAFAGGDPPDVFYMPDEWYPKYAAQGQIADLTDVVGDMEDAYDPAIWSIGQYNGSLYGVPFMAVIHAFLVNKTLFDEVGVEIPTTWSEIRSAAEAITDTDKGQYGIQYGVDAMWNFLVPLLAAGGTTVMNEDMTEVTANDPGGVAAWKVALEEIGHEDGSLTPLGTVSDQALSLGLSGKIGMIWKGQNDISTTWRTEAPDLELDVIPLPPVDGTEGEESVWTNVGFLFVSEASDHQEEAHELLRFLASKHVQEEYVVNGIEAISPMKDVVAADLDPVVEKFLSFLPKGRGPVTSVHWPEVSQALGQDGESVISGIASAEDALEGFASNMGGVLDGQ